MPASPTTLADLVHDHAQRNGDKPAIIFMDRPISYAALDAQIERAANALAARGVRHGDRVAIMLPNVPQFIVAYYAVMRLGAVVVPINVLYKTEEIAYVLDDSEATVFITHEAFWSVAAGAVAQSAALAHVIFVGQSDAPAGTTAWQALMAEDAPPRAAVTVQPGDLATICYTSGTTGRSKGAMLTHRNFLANLEQMEGMCRCVPTPADRVLLVLPLFHIYAMNVGMNGYLRVGGTIILVPRFEPVPVLEQMQKHGATSFYGAPPMYVAWVHTPGLGEYDLSALRFAFSGAAALPVQILERFKQLTGVEIVEGYGLTETAPVTHSNSVAMVSKAGSIGLPIPGVEVRLVDDEDRDVPLGAEGEIICRGENVLGGYWRKPEASAEALKGGWFHTGDIATMDADGYYYIVDRKKDMINAGGFKVWPREVEEVLFRHPAVKEAAVVAMPDEYAGERPMAFIALKEGQSATADELMEYCKEHLATFKVPRHIAFREDLPKLPTGKVLRRVLREEAKSLATTPAD